ncbi:hypothetical protein G5I_09484 [Acromyrmex echinatior]|uniref:Uncharacterized protein n=1 Tax=Acromyrmex echinatior TaxID=103372 RepID=F4WUC6_ACREC|nr:hypothetical protein G5I_09484 [Acromyrmex echinatior]
MVGGLLTPARPARRNAEHRAEAPSPARNVQPRDWQKRAFESREWHSPGGFQEPTANPRMPRGARVLCAVCTSPLSAAWLPGCLSSESSPPRLVFFLGPPAVGVVRHGAP